MASLSTSRICWSFPDNSKLIFRLSASSFQGWKTSRFLLSLYSDNTLSPMRWSLGNNNWQGFLHLVSVIQMSQFLMKINIIWLLSTQVKIWWLKIFKFENRSLLSGIWNMLAIMFWKKSQLKQAYLNYPRFKNFKNYLNDHFS